MTLQARTPSAGGAVPVSPAVAPAPTRETRKFSVAEYYRMAEVGILAPDERVELIEGEIVVMPPIGPGHADNVNEFNEVLARYAPGLFRNQHPEPGPFGRRL